jgi:hypothetical protein
MKRFRIFAVMIMFLTIMFVFLAGSLYAAESGCVTCHTSDKILNSLHKPVKAKLAEGVG